MRWYAGSQPIPGAASWDVIGDAAGQIVLSAEAQQSTEVQARALAVSLKDFGHETLYELAV